MNPSLTRPEIAYFLWQYPVLSQTFIQREIAALQDAGVPVLVIAEGHGSTERMDARMHALCETTVYVGRLRLRLLARGLRRTAASAHRALAALAAAVRGKANSSIRHSLVVYLKAVTVAAILREHRIAHIHAPWANESALIALVAAKLLDISYSVQARAYEIHRRGVAEGLREKLAPARFVITNSCFNLKRIRELVPRAEWHKTHRIYNGLPLELFATRRGVRDASQMTRLLSVGRLIEEKGFVHLLRSCHALRERGYRFRCDIVGGSSEADAGYQASLMELHSALALEDCIFFSGPLPFEQVLDSYRAADVFVLPCVTASDGGRDITPNALLEAMAMGLPVVATRGTALGEIVEHEVSGLLVARGDEAALADAIARIIDDPDFSGLLGRNARTRVDERFDIRKNIRAYAELFRSVAAS